MTNTVLLARPHPRIFSLMQPWLTGLGFDPFPCAALTDVARAPAEGVRGAVISMTPASSVYEGAADVLRTMRERYPGLPVLLATIADRRAMLQSLEASLGQRSNAGLTIRWIGEVFPTSTGVGTSHLGLLIHRDDLLDPARAKEAGQVLLQHFGRT